MIPYVNRRWNSLVTRDSDLREGMNHEASLCVEVTSHLPESGSVNLPVAHLFVSVVHEVITAFTLEWVARVPCRA